MKPESYRRSRIYWAFQLTPDAIYDIEKWPEWMKQAHEAAYIRRSDMNDGGARLVIDCLGEVSHAHPDWWLVRYTETDLRSFREDQFDDQFVHVPSEELEGDNMGTVVRDVRDTRVSADDADQALDVLVSYLKLRKLDSHIGPTLDLIETRLNVAASAALPDDGEHRAEQAVRQLERYVKANGNRRHSIIQLLKDQKAGGDY